MDNQKILSQLALDLQEIIDTLAIHQLSGDRDEKIMQLADKVIDLFDGKRTEIVSHPRVHPFLPMRATRIISTTARSLSRLR